jgi:hypothetical protein
MTFQMVPASGAVTGVPAPAGAAAGPWPERAAAVSGLISPPSLTFTTKALPSTSTV